MEALRSFLTGKRLAIVGILLAVPFAFLGSSSFGTAFTNYGKVNGLIVSALDVNIALNSVTSRLQQLYGDDLNLDTLEEGLLNNLVRNEIISQKALLYQAKKMNLLSTEEDAKRLIMTEPSFQTDGRFNQEIFEATIRANGILPNEYIENVQNSSLVNEFLLAISNSNFQIESELKKQIKLIEQERGIDFFKIDFKNLKESINPNLESAVNYYEENRLLFMDDEKRSFKIISLSQEEYLDQVDIPKDFINDEYKNYIERINSSAERRISHIMVEVSNYDSKQNALDAINAIQNKINVEMTFEEAAMKFSEDMVSAEFQGDLGFSSGDSFPLEFEQALDRMALNEISNIIELDESFHIIKYTEENKETAKTFDEMQEKFVSELKDAESKALMLDSRDLVEDLLLEGLSVEEIADSINKNFRLTNTFGYDDFNLFENTVIKDFLYGLDYSNDFAEILELEDQIIVASVSEVLEPSVLPFDNVTDEVFERIRENEANLMMLELEGNLIQAMNDKSILVENSNVLKDSFTSVKRGSSLFPPDVINDIFSAEINSVKTKKTFNSDMYIFKVNEIKDPSEDFINSVISDYEDFSSSTSLVKLNLILEKEIGRKVRDNITNLNI